MAGVRGMRPETLIYEGEAKHLRDVWIAVRAARCAKCSSTSPLARCFAVNCPTHVTRFHLRPRYVGDQESYEASTYRRLVPR